ncbi:MAG: cyclic nucleotide-binding domain-containing protein [Nitrospinaceae bacterium]|nr:cyclic nucleotide-binding domain-containing protein [Nitrospinaceae bacterium]
MKTIPAKTYPAKKHSKIIFQKTTSITTAVLIEKLQSNYSFFMDMAHSEINELLSFCTRETFHPGYRIFSKGDVSDTFYLLVSGEIRILIGNREISITPGQIFGEMTLFQAEKRTASAMTKKTSVVLSISSKVLSSQLLSLQRKVMTGLAHQLPKIFAAQTIR